MQRLHVLFNVRLPSDDTYLMSFSPVWLRRYKFLLRRAALRELLAAKPTPRRKPLELALPAEL